VLLKNARLRRCAASSVFVAYGKVRLIPSDLRALHPGIFEQPAKKHILNTLSRFKGL
jgi:hypothetical protein